jgi:hypothetical protein
LKVTFVKVQFYHPSYDGLHEGYDWHKRIVTLVFQLNTTKKFPRKKSSKTLIIYALRNELAQ